MFRRIVLVAVVVVVMAAPSMACSKPGTDAGGARGAGSPSPKGDYSNLSGKLQGSGSTFQKAFEEEVKANLQKLAPNVTVDYGGGGSGKGKTDLQEQVVDFAGTDSTIKPEDAPKFKGGAFLYFPVASAPITVSYNLKGIDKLQLSPSTIAKIFQRQARKWNDDAIKADNPGTNLPDTDITVVHRADGSGTTSNFTKFLKAAAGSGWTLDAGDTVNWPADTQAGNGNAGVAQAVRDSEGTLGYVDYSDAKATGLALASVKNKAGKYVAPTLDGASAAVASAKVSDDLIYNPINADGDGAYPITAPTWIVVYQKQTDKAKGNALRGFLAYVLNDGQGLAAGVDFAKLPDALRLRAVAQLDKLQIG